MKYIHSIAANRRSGSVIIISSTCVYAGIVAFRGVIYSATSIGWIAIVAIALISTVLAFGHSLVGCQGKARAGQAAPLQHTNETGRPLDIDFVWAFPCRLSRHS